MGRAWHGTCTHFTIGRSSWHPWRPDKRRISAWQRKQSLLLSGKRERFKRHQKVRKTHTWRWITILTKMKSVENVNPQFFRVGDIVEAQVSFIAVPLKDNKYKMIAVLRLIPLLDTTFSKVSLLRTYLYISYPQTSRMHWSVEWVSLNRHSERWHWSSRWAMANTWMQRSQSRWRLANPLRGARKQIDKYIHLFCVLMVDPAQSWNFAKYYNLSIRENECWETRTYISKLRKLP